MTRSISNYVSTPRFLLRFPTITNSITVAKYKKAKSHYYSYQAQVEQLQNTLANQRLSQSRTSLDDGEYTTRFSRLEGAIKNLAYNIREDWLSIPPWLTPVINADACTTKSGKQEMLAAGRAFLARWLHEEVFAKSFHPALDADLSQTLKRIEHNIRATASPPTSHDESDVLTAKVVQWRLATIDGLMPMLNSAQAAENREAFSGEAVMNLTGALAKHLRQPTPPGLESSAGMIIELAVGIAANLPLESRDINVAYPLPGMMVVERSMALVEGSLPYLEHPGSKKDNSEKRDGGNGLESRKGSLIGKKEDTKDERVRIAAGMSVEVKGKAMLVRAPVWTMS